MTPSLWRQWLQANHGTETAILVGMHKVGSGKPCMTWAESVDEALCFGWIDGVRRSIDATCYSIRFSARRKGSIWSRINIAKAEALIAAERMAPAGLEKFRSRSEARSSVYSFEQGAVEFDASARRRFEASREAWRFFCAQPPSYRKRVAWWVISARLPATRERRLSKAIALSEGGRRL